MLLCYSETSKATVTTNSCYNVMLTIAIITVHFYRSYTSDSSYLLIVGEIYHRSIPYIIYNPPSSYKALHNKALICGNLSLHS